MKTRYLPVALAALVLLAGCLAPLQATESSTTSTADVPTISVSGTGTTTAAPDLAVVFVSVTATADTADPARQQVANDVQRMRTALREAGVPDDAVTTTSFHISPRYDYREREQTLLGYEAAHSFRIEVAPDRAGAVVDAAVGNGADRVDGVQFTLTDETRESLRSEALTRAMDAARADADTVAAAAGMEVTGVQTASTGGVFVPYADVRFAEDAQSGAATVFEPGPVTVTATVSVTYTAA